MLSLSLCEEVNFGSGPVFVHHVLELERCGRPVDLVVFGFTVTELAALVSQVCRKPLAGFILQPSIIPSRDARWHAVLPLDAHRRHAESKPETDRQAWGGSLTSHETLKVGRAPPGGLPLQDVEDGVSALGPRFAHRGRPRLSPLGGSPASPAQALARGRPRDDPGRGSRLRASASSCVGPSWEHGVTPGSVHGTTEKRLPSGSV